MDTIRAFFDTPIAKHVGAGILLFAAAVVAGLILKRFLSTTGRKLIARTETDLDDKVLGVILPRIKWLSIAAGAFFAIEELTKAFTTDQATAVKIVSYARGIVFVVFVWVVTILTLRTGTMLLRHVLERHARKSGSEISENLVPLLSRIVSIVVISFAILTVLGQFGVNINSLLVFLGGGSVALALAAQDTLSNMIAGFLIMIDQPFRIGDRIKLPSGEVGDVHEIGLRTTHILDFDNNMIISPNAELIKAKLINYSYPQQHIKIAVEVGVAYGTNVEQARAILLDIAGRHPQVLETPNPEVFLTALADSSVNLLLVGRTDDYKLKFATETNLREQIYGAFLKQGIEIPFPQRVVRIEQKNG